MLMYGVLALYRNNPSMLFMFPRRTLKLKRIMFADASVGSCRMKKKWSEFEGYSLSEVVIAITLLGIIFLGVFKALGEGMDITQKRIDTDTANSFVIREMEYLRSLDWADIVALNSEDPFSLQPTNSKFTAKRYAENRNGRSNQRIIKLEVSWNDAKSHEHSVSSVTFFTQDGITN